MAIRSGGSHGTGARVPEGTRVYAVGDIHGRNDLLERLHARIRADAADAGSARRVVIYLGDYVDRGPGSRAVIDDLLAGPLPGFETVHLVGNHDAWLLQFLDDVAAGPGWLANGGQAALESYGVEPDEPLGGFPGLRKAQALLRAALPPEHLVFLRGLDLYHREGDYLFVHAGIRPGVPLDQQDPADLIWIRDEFLCSRDDHGMVVVHGHSITREPEVLANRVGIDTGAYASGRLTSLVLDGASHRFLQT